jgi:hypothetical protein
MKVLEFEVREKHKREKLKCNEDYKQFEININLSVEAGQADMELIVNALMYQDIEDLGKILSEMEEE